MKKIKIVNFYNIRGEESLSNFDGIIKLNPYYNTDCYSITKLGNNAFGSNLDNVYFIISPKNTKSIAKYENCLEELIQLSDNNYLYYKVPYINKSKGNFNKRKRKLSFGKYIVKKDDGNFMIVESFLCKNQFTSENVFEYVDIATGEVYSDEIFEKSPGYPISKITSNDILNSEFFSKNKNIIYSLIKEWFDEKTKNDNVQVLKKRKTYI